MDWQPVISVQQQTSDNDFCHLSISNVRFAFWAFFRKPEKLGSHTVSKWWWPGDPDVKDDPNDLLTRWPNDPVPCVSPCFSSVRFAEVDEVLRSISTSLCPQSPLLQPWCPCIYCCCCCPYSSLLDLLLYCLSMFWVASLYFCRYLKLPLPFTSHELNWT